MATCPECRETYGDDVQTCPTHGSALIPDELVVASEPPLKEGTMVGEYRIEKKLGAGTFGDVYAGEQPVIGKRVAVKVLNRRFASDPVMVSRFVAEARAVNKIRQRNIIDIFSFGVLPGLERHYFVMELLDGLTLGALLERTGALPVALVLPIVRGIADALDAVHEAGITHRDLKPDNVFLARERDGSYFPKLLDFGIAKLIGDDAAHKTGSGMVLGTPRYMSPEQARGKPADHRADVYALGVMIHEMLTGGPLFVGDSAVDMLLKQAVDDPPRMSSISADVPPELDEPVLAMLEKRPQDRPSSAGKAVAMLAARARELGLDRVAGPTLADLALDDSPTRRGLPQFAGTTVTIRRGRDGGVPRTASTDPLSKTERAPASGATPKPSPREGAASTLRSKAPPVRVSGATSAPPADGTGEPSSSSTESVSTLETASAIERRSRARRFQIVAGVVAVLAVGLSTWAIGRPSQLASARSPVISLPSTSPLSGPSTTPPASPPTNSDAEPTIKPEVVSGEVAVRLTTRPAEVEVWLGDRDLGSSAGPVSLPRGASRIELRLKKPGFNDETVALTPDRDQALEATLSPHRPLPIGAAKTPVGAGKPPSGDGKLERVLGGRD
jgi:eukaryotic-like serine/threonine-protein kinase